MISDLPFCGLSNLLMTLSKRSEKVKSTTISNLQLLSRMPEDPTFKTSKNYFFKIFIYAKRKS
ncbi:hypothetical protein YC2023_045446 [Brassica napus]